MKKLTPDLKVQVESYAGFERYIPLSPKHYEIHTCAARERWDFSGNRKGKTAEFIVEDLWNAVGWYPDYYSKIRSPIPSQGRITATNFNDGIMKVIIPELMKWCPRKYLLKGSFQESYDTRHRILNLKTIKNCMNENPDPSTLSTIDLMSSDQDPQAFAGTARHWIHHDEHCPRIIYQENKMRLISTQGRLWGGMTPIDETGQPLLSWEYDDLYERFETRKGDPEFEKSLMIFRGATMDNPMNTREVIEDIVRGLDEDTKRVRLYGDFVVMSGLVFKEYLDREYIPVYSDEDFVKRSGHLVKPFNIPKHWPRFSCIDPHPRTPTFTLWCAVAPDGTHYFYDEFWPSVEGITLKSYFDLLKLKESSSDTFKRVRYRLIDPSAKENDPILGTNVKDELDKLFKAYDGTGTREANKNVNAGIQKIHEGLKPERRTDGTYRPRILLFSNLSELRYEFRHYIWDEFAARQEFHDPKQKPRKKRDHGLDNLRYLEISGMNFEVPTIYSPWKGNPYMR